MSGFFAPNIKRSGRLVRLAGGLLLLLGAVPCWWVSPWLSIPMAISGLFVLFEAARGWCFLRACGIRTRL